MSKNRIYRVACSVLLCVLMLGSILVPSSSDKRSSAASSSLLSTYGSLFGRSGNCVSLSQLQNSSTLAHIKSQYNSITLENEMKPDALLGYSPSLITRDSAKNLGYYVSGSFTESYVPKIISFLISVKNKFISHIVTRASTGNWIITILLL